MGLTGIPRLGARTAFVRIEEGVEDRIGGSLKTDHYGTDKGSGLVEGCTATAVGDDLANGLAGR
ncbi:hypothetical protein LPJGGPFB_04895 [Ensifer adhaerens]|uniref:hypothetical protein n=1 Tax=Ensifer adhaerens TaxID=106592 RepID=UPI001AEDC721|nr:hypothetical protein [Ensifer adhaerens]NRP21636.1 hypothetical protein [Ensifer adhaerens]